MVPNRCCGLAGRDDLELQVDCGVPGLAVEPRGMHQVSRFAPNVNAAVTASTDSVVPASAARTGTAVRPRPGSTANRTPADMVTGAPAPASHPASQDGRPGLAAASRRAVARAEASPPGRPGSPRDQQHDDGRGAGGQDQPVGADPGSGLGQPRVPDRHQRRRSDRHAARQDRPGGPGYSHLDQPGCGELAAGHPQRGEDRVVRPGLEQQPGRGLADDQQRGSRRAPPRRSRARLPPGGWTARSAATCVLSSAT